MKNFVLFGVLIFLSSTAAKADRVMCTMDAKLCPDGSYVARTGPNCEFSICKGDVDSTDDTVGTGYISPDEPYAKTIPDYPIIMDHPIILDVEYLTEHRTALQGQTVNLRGKISNTLLGEEACPSNMGMCAQPRIILMDINSSKNYTVIVLLNESDNTSYVVGQTIEISGTVLASLESVILRATH